MTLVVKNQRYNYYRFSAYRGFMQQRQFNPIMAFQEIKTLISQNKTGQALKKLLDITPEDREFHQEILLLSARFERYNQEKRQGTAAQQDQYQELSRINSALLEIADQLEKSGAKAPFFIFKKWGKWVWPGVGLAVLALIIWKMPALSEKSGEKTFQLTVYVHGEKGKQDIVLQHTGKLIVDLDNDRRAANIGENGRTHFGEIPLKFKNRQIPIHVEAKGFEVVFPDSAYTLDGNPVYFAVKQDESLARVTGVVRDEESRFFLEGATISAEGEKTVTDTLGRFDLYIPREKQNDQYLILIKKEGYRDETERYYPQSGFIEIRLKKNVVN